MTRRIRCNLLLCIAYAATGWLALHASMSPGYASPLFPPAGIALAALLMRGPACLPGILAGSLLVQLGAVALSGIGSHAWITLLVPPLGAAAQAWIGYWLTRTWLGLPMRLAGAQAIVRFVALIAPLSCLVSASVAMPALLATGSFQSGDLWSTWADWWLGDTLGVLIVTPAILAFMGQPAADWRRRRWSVALPLILTMAALALSFQLINNGERQRLQAQFEHEADLAANLIGQRLDAQLDQMLALESLAAFQPQLSRQQWRNFVGPLLERYPGTQSLSWSPRISDDQRADFEARMAADGHPNFRIRGRDGDGRGFVAARADDYLPVVYVEPFETNRGMLGLDTLQLATTADAARRSLIERSAIAAPPLRSMPEATEQHVVAVQLPVADARSPTYAGMVSAVFRIDEIVAAALTGHRWEEIDLCLIERSAAGKAQRLFGPSGCEQAAAGSRQMRSERTVRFAEREWTLRATSTRVFFNTHRNIVFWLTLAFGLLATALLGAFLLLISARPSKARAFSALPADEAIPAADAALAWPRLPTPSAPPPQADRELEQALRQAIADNQLVLHYQPQVSSSGQALGCEALVRWQHPERGLLLPQQFIGFAEESGLILPLGEWVLRAACRQQAAWQAAGNRLVVAVNIAPLQFRQADFPDLVRRILDETGANPQCVELELTESALMLPPTDLQARLRRLRSWGLRLALDGFGTGYSSLSDLKRLPIDRLKLDRSFVMDLPNDPDDAAIAAATLALAHNLGMEVVAEGVEHEAQRDFLHERGCAVLQGFLFSKPLNVVDFARWHSGSRRFAAPSAGNSDSVDPEKCCA